MLEFGPARKSSENPSTKHVEQTLGWERKTQQIRFDQGSSWRACRWGSIQFLHLWTAGQSWRRLFDGAKKKED